MQNNTTLYKMQLNLISKQTKCLGYLLFKTC